MKHAEMNKACQAAASVLDKGGSALDAVTAAIAVLEDAPLLNAGTGSNLNMEGKVECDASVMDGSGIFGGVGAAGGIRNPVKAAALLAKESRQPLPNGLVRPVLLVGDGARRWASANNLECGVIESEISEMHITERAREQWNKYIAILESSRVDADQQPTAKRQKRNAATNSSQIDELLDTVGCVVVDSQGCVAAGVSSGGIVLKQPGRVGEAALYGSGCWAENAKNTSTPAVACSVTGVGERVIQHLVSLKCAERIKINAVSNDVAISKLCADFLEETMLAPETLNPRDCGALCISALPSSDGDILIELGVAHCANSMAIAFLECRGKKEIKQAHILRKPNNQKVQCFTFGTTL